MRGNKAVSAFLFDEKYIANRYFLYGLFCTFTVADRSQENA